jgi:hypothetical protein
MPAVRVVRNQATVFERANVKSGIVAPVTPGTVLEVVDKEAAWYWVLLSRDKNGSRHTGWIEARHVEVETPAALRVAPRTLTGEVEETPSVLNQQPAKPAKPTRADRRAEARMKKAEQELEKARQEYERLVQGQDAQQN